MQKELLSPIPLYYSTLPYPPIYYLHVVPFAALPFVPAFITYEALALLACVVVVTLIVRRRAAIAVVLASPFTAWNIGCGQNGLLTASLIGAALLALERHPLLAGVFIGGLTYKPHLGILFPVALIAARKWRAIAVALGTTSLLVALSAAAFGLGAWAGFPRQLMAQGHSFLLAGADLHWGLQDTVFGLVHYLGGGDGLAWLAQGVTTLGAALIVWLLWRSRARHPLKAAALSAAALIATPYGFVYDMAAIAVPLAFLARDQIDRGLLRGEQTIMIALFLTSLAVFPTSGSIPIGVAIVGVLMSLISRRAMSGPHALASENFSETTSLAGD
jgi:arabinofuranan 3-O-arabinosyltransferase